MRGKTFGGWRSDFGSGVALFFEISGLKFVYGATVSSLPGSADGVDLEGSASAGFTFETASGLFGGELT
jgi:hypothetical protein